MLESRRQELEQRMRERVEYSGPGEPVWWDDEEEEEYEAPLREELPSPWIEQHEAPVQFPAPPRRVEEPRVIPAAPMQRQKLASARRRRNRLAMLETREGLLQAIVLRAKCLARLSPSARSTRASRSSRLTDRNGL